MDRPDCHPGDTVPGMHAEPFDKLRTAPVEARSGCSSIGSGHLGLEQTGAPAALRAQILATEHWSLLATRSMTWSEIFSRTGIFLTVLSAAVVALSLVAQGTGLGQSFRVFALLVLPIGLLIGLSTYIRLVEADIEDVWLVTGMNRSARLTCSWHRTSIHTSSQVITTMRPAYSRPTASAVRWA